MNYLKTIVVLLTTATLSLSQDAGFTIKMDVALVSVDVGVTDARGVPVMTLTKEDFQVLEDGVPREIRNFAPAGTPYSCLLLFDASGSTQNQWPFLIEAVNGFIRGLGRGDRIEIATFASTVEKLVDWRLARGERVDVQFRPPGAFGYGANPSNQGNSIRGGPILSTDFYGSLEWAANEARGVNGRRGVIVFTDGQDSREVKSQEQSAFHRALSAVEQSETPFFFVGINTDVNSVSPPSAAPRAQQKRARARMEELAYRSGGRIFLPRKIDDVVPLYADIARDLGSLYTLGFSPVTADNRGYHRIEVRVRGGRLKVSQSRQGYNAADADDRAVPSVAASVPLAVTVPATLPPSVLIPVPTPPAIRTPSPVVPFQSNNRSVITGPAESGYAIPTGATLFISPGLSFENDLRTAFQKKAVPLKIVSNRQDASFILANEAAPGNPPSITITNAKTGVVCFAYTLRRSPAPGGTQSAADTIASNIGGKVTSGK
jgi:Ca-activated chloride channel family protein